MADDPNWITVADQYEGPPDYAPKELVDVVFHRIREIHSLLMTENETRRALNLGCECGQDPPTQAWLGATDALIPEEQPENPPEDLLLVLKTDDVEFHALFDAARLKRLDVAIRERWFSNKTKVQAAAPGGGLLLLAKGWNDRDNRPDGEAQLDLSDVGQFIG